MEVFIGLLLVLFVISLLGPWFWVLLGVGVAGYWAVVLLREWLSAREEAQLSPEERARRREQREEEERRRDEERHAWRMARIEQERIQQQVEAQEAARKKERNGQLLGTAAKIGVPIVLSMLTGGNHRHRH